MFGYDVDDKRVSHHRHQEGEQHGTGENHFCWVGVVEASGILWICRGGIIQKNNYWIIG